MCIFLYFSLVDKIIIVNDYSDSSWCQAKLLEFFFALCMCFAFRLNGKWEVKKLHHGLIYCENFGFSTTYHVKKLVGAAG